MGKLKSIGVRLDGLDLHQQLAKILCPTSAKMVKLVNKYISILFNARKRLDEGDTLDQLGFRPPSVSVESDSDSDFELDSEYEESSEEE